MKGEHAHSWHHTVPRNRGAGRRPKPQRVLLGLKYNKGTPGQPWDNANKLKDGKPKPQRVLLRNGGAHSVLIPTQDSYLREEVARVMVMMTTSTLQQQQQQHARGLALSSVSLAILLGLQNLQDFKSSSECKQPKDHGPRDGRIAI